MFLNKIEILNTLLKRDQVKVTKKLEKFIQNQVSRESFLVQFADYLCRRLNERDQEWMDPETFVREAKRAAHDLEQGEEDWFGKPIYHSLTLKKMAIRLALENLPKLIVFIFRPGLAKKALDKFQNEPLLLYEKPLPWDEKMMVEKAAKSKKITRKDLERYLKNYPQKIVELKKKIEDGIWTPF